jgi:predicted nucleic acid-binding protein
LKYLLDTCVISELIKTEKNNKVVKWIKKRKESSLFISVLTVGEIQKGISKLPDSHKKEYLKTWIDDDLKKRFAGRIIEITEEIATSWGEIQAKSESEGKKCQ